MLDAKIIDFLEEAGPIFFVGPSAGRAVGLETELPDYHIIASRLPAEADLLAAGAKLFALGKDVPNAGKLLSEPAVVEYIQRQAAGRTANILTFKPSPMIEIACAKHGWRYLGNSSALNREWEDKVKFAQKTDALGLRNAGSRIVKLEAGESLPQLDFAAGRRYVVQFSRGYSGNSTFLVEGGAQAEAIFTQAAGRRVKLSEYVPGDTYTLDACLGPFGLLLSQPILQITGFGEFNRQRLGTCGNDYAYGRQLGEAGRHAIEEGVRRVAGQLQAEGYRGILGFDFVVAGETAHIIEVNPRLVGSIPVFTKLQLEAGEMPFLLLHLLAFLGFDFSGTRIAAARRDFEYSQLILRNNASEARRVDQTLESGIYVLSAGRLELCRRAYFGAGQLAPDEFFLECAPRGALIGPDMEYANLQLPCGIMETSGSFREGFLDVKAEIFKHLILS